MTVELLTIAAASAVGSALAVWGVVRHEMSRMRSEIQRAHNRIDGHLGAHFVEGTLQ